MGRKKKKKNNNVNNVTLYASSTNLKKEGSKMENKATSVSTVSTVSTRTYTSSYYVPKVNYDMKGKKNETSYPEFVGLCKVGQSELKKELEWLLVERGYPEIVSGDGFLYAKGDIPVLLTAHMDTVHAELIKDFYEYYDEEKDRHIISSPQGIGGDDRCGIYMILEIIKERKCSVLFCEDEESGGIGSRKFCRTSYINDLKDMKYLIELDRKGDKDAVFYDCENYDFTRFIEDNTGYSEAFGSFSDISHLSPECKVASVNLSCGYYNSHTTSEYVVMEEMLNSIEVVKNLVSVECESFEYIEYKSYYRGSYYPPKKNQYGYNTVFDDYDRYCGYYGNGYDDYDDYYDDYYHNKQDNTKKTVVSTTVNSTIEKSLVVYVYEDYTGKTLNYVSNARTELEAWGKFFINNSSYCFEDVYDYEYYDDKIAEDGWYDCFGY